MANWVQAASAGISCLIVKDTDCVALLLRKNSFRMQVQEYHMQESGQNIVRRTKDPKIAVGRAGSNSDLLW